MKRNKLWCIVILIFMMVLIIDSRRCVSGAIRGIELCIYTVIPALFPYCVLSMIFQSAVSGSNFKLLRPIEKVCNLPLGSGLIFLLGILGGYPTGAICTDRANLSRKTAENMAIFCNNAGPSFIFGIASLIFPDLKILFIIWITQIFSAIITGIVLNSKIKPGEFHPMPKNKPLNLITDAAKAMANVCGIIVLFRVFITCMETWLSKILPMHVLTVIIGITELTNGITYLNNIENQNLQIIICCGLLSFGGICIAIQTLSVCKSVRLIKYISGKALQAIISMCIAGLMLYNVYILLMLLTFLGFIVITQSVKSKKEVAFSF